MKKIYPPPQKKIISKNYFFSISISNPNRNFWVDSRRSACAMGKWAPPLANAIFHINTTYMRRKISGQTLLKASLKLRFSIFRKLNYSIKSLTFVHILEALKKFNRSNFGHFRKKAILHFLFYKILINQIRCHNFQESESQRRIKHTNEDVKQLLYDHLLLNL